MSFKASMIVSFFIDILCMWFSCQAHPLYWTVNPAKTGAYSAYLIMPKITGVVDFKKYVGMKEIKEEDSNKIF